MAIQFFMSSRLAFLRAHLHQFHATATVEAEYGNDVVEGSILTMAHHGPRAGQKAPCSYQNRPTDVAVEAVGLSHLDLDSVGGCAALLARKTGPASFWELAEFVDLNGAHKLGSSGASPENLRRLHAYWAWAEANKVFAPQDGKVVDVTDKVLAAVSVLEGIMKDDPEMLAAGDAFKAAEEALNARSFVGISEKVVVRVTDRFTNHLYATPTGQVGKMVVALRTDNRSITVSLADPIPGVSCIEILQRIWGKEAGGHVGIAGGPRGYVMGWEELTQAVQACQFALRDR